MEHVAAPPEGEVRRGRLRGFAADVAPKLFLTLIAAGISALLIPWITGRWQDHKQQIELRTALAGDMSRAYTSVIVTGRFVTGGLVYAGSADRVKVTAASQTVWTSALHEWLVESGTIGAQLTGRYGSDGIAQDWRAFSAAVTRYMQLGSQIPAADRTALLTQERAYVGEPTIGWAGLRVLHRFKEHPEFRSAYAQLGTALIGRGDALIERELTLRPRV